MRPTNHVIQPAIMFVNKPGGKKLYITEAWPNQVKGMGQVERDEDGVEVTRPADTC